MLRRLTFPNREYLPCAVSSLLSLPPSASPTCPCGRTEPMLWTVELPHAEVHNHNARNHWNRRYQSHREWKENTALLARTVRTAFPTPPVHVVLECVQADRRRRDVDNMVAGTAMKGVLDGLVDAGLLEDDSYKQVREITCRLTSDPALDCHRWTLKVGPAALSDDETTF